MSCTWLRALTSARKTGFSIDRIEVKIDNITDLSTISLFLCDDAGRHEDDGQDAFFWHRMANDVVTNEDPGTR